MNGLLNTDNFTYACRWVDKTCMDTSDVELRFLSFPEEARNRGELFSQSCKGYHVRLVSYEYSAFSPVVPSADNVVILNLPGARRGCDVDTVIIPSKYWPAIRETLAMVGASRHKGEDWWGSPVTHVQGYDESVLLLL